jgi:hypothetical protein
MNSLSNYLIILQKLRNISDYIEKIDSLNPNISDYITKCKLSCLDEIKLYPEIISFLDEIKNQAMETEQDKQQDKQEQDKQQEDKQEFKEDLELKNEINSLANIMTSTIKTSNDDKLSIDSFETLGSGLAKLFKVSSNNLPPNNLPQNNLPLPQIKNEINNINSNINFEIRRK